jgi:uncharacterized membrane protein
MLRPVIAASITTLMLLCSPVRADIIVCNEFRTPIHLAFASQNKDNFIAAGWWSIVPNACQTVDFAFEGETLYYTADSDSYPSGDGGISQSHWGNGVQLFVPREDFDLDKADAAREGTKAEKFDQSAIPPQFQGRPVMITLRFVAFNTVVTVASRTSTRGSRR